MSRVGRTFQSLSIRNYRLFLTGQSVSISGNWMQKVGQAWLVLELTGSGTLVGLTAAMQHLPTMLLGMWGGLAADRFDKRHLMLLTQALATILAVLLGALTATGAVRVWMVMSFALLLGIVDMVDRPARKAFVFEMVGESSLTNAITLNIVAASIGRILGPAIAGVLIATIGIAVSFYVNGLTYVVVIASLLLMKTSELERPHPIERRRGLVREGADYVWKTPELLATLLLLATMAMLAYAWEVTLALLARDTFEGDAEVFGLMLSAMGVGSILGGLGVASRGYATMRRLLSSAAAFGILLAGVAVAPNLPIALFLLVLLGGASVAFRSMAGTHAQLLATAQMRGRVTGILVVASVGTKPIGSPIVGWVGEHMGARAAMLLGAVATGMAIVAVQAYLRKQGVSTTTRHASSSLHELGVTPID